MTTATMQSPRRSILDRINPRMIAFVLIVSAPFLWFGYVFLDQTLTGGIENHGDYLKVDLKAMGQFPFDAGIGTLNDIPTKWRGLDGKRVMLEGFMYAPNSAGPGVVEFQFVYNITKCCFSGPPLVQERVFARVPNKHMVMMNYGEMVKIVGTLHVQPKKEDGVTQSVYTIEVDKIEPV